jgi:hypothetical protein
MELVAAAACIGVRFATKQTSLGVPVLLVIAAGWAAYLLQRVRRSPSTWQDWGLSPPRLAAGWGAYAMVALVAGALVGAYWLSARPSVVPPSLLSLLVYPGWVLAQEFAVQNIVTLNLVRLNVPKAIIPPLAALAFGIAHLPDLPLAALATLAGCAFTWAWLRRPNLLALVLTHTGLGLAAAAVVLGQDPAAEFVAAVRG